MMMDHRGYRPTEGSIGLLQLGSVMYACGVCKVELQTMRGETAHAAAFMFSLSILGWVRKVTEVGVGTTGMGQLT